MHLLDSSVEVVVTQRCTQGLFICCSARRIFAPYALLSHNIIETRPASPFTFPSTHIYINSRNSRREGITHSFIRAWASETIVQRPLCTRYKCGTSSSKRELESYFRPLALIAPTTIVELEMRIKVKQMVRSLH